MKPSTDPDLQLLEAAADPVRLSILRQLSTDGPTCACDFTDCCDIKQSTVSHHLKVLREAGWIEGERRGTWIWYSIRPEAAQRFGVLAGTIRPAGARSAATLGPTSTPVPSADLGPATVGLGPATVGLGPATVGLGLADADTDAAADADADASARTLPVVQPEWRQW